ncbi:MAG: hypothetical protein BWX83_00618 [Candidatus Cloacimonetes bacterium ADurb.Bin117]|nr:MAG: hypothetical protein BWX83_00618 [Candidatus Cloacimonetes bacterium ADurb.Bin117]
MHDIKQISDDAAGAGTASRTHRNTLFAGIVDQVFHHQVIAIKAHAVDHIQLEINAFPHLISHFRILFFCRLFAERAEIAAHVLKLRRGLDFGQQELVVFQFQIDHVGDLQRVGIGLRFFRKQLFHLFGAFEVELLRVISHAVWVVEGFCRLDAEQDVVGFVVFLMQIVAVVGEYQRLVHLFGQFDQSRHHFALKPQPMVLDFQEISVSKDPLMPFHGFPGFVFPVVGQQGGDFALNAGAEADQAFAVLFQ